MLKNLPPQFIIIIKELFEKSINSGQLPNTWKHAIITLIPKPNKDHQTVTGFRPISLLSCLSKLLERIINIRLSEYLEKNNLIMPEQCGFRKNRSTIDNLLRFSSDIYKTNIRPNKSEILISCILDIEKCFDKIWINGLKYKIQNLDINSNIKAWLCDFITDRSFKIKLNRTFSDNFCISAGVPQGAILSPTLYILYTSDIPRQEIIDNGTKMSGYADDFNLWNLAPIKYSFLARKALQKSIDEMTQWADRWRMKLNPQKCNSILIKKGASPTSIYYKSLYIHEEEIPKTDTITFLGLDYTQNFKFDEYIQRKIRTCSNILNGIKIARGKRIKYEILVQIYNTFIKSSLTYAGPAWYPFLNKTQIKTLESFHRKCLKICLNYPPWTKTSEVFQKSKTTSLQEYLHNQTQKYIQKCRDSAIIQAELIDNLEQISNKQVSFLTGLEI